MNVQALGKLSDRLAELELRYRLALEAGGVGVWDWNLGTDELFWDDQQLVNFGATRSTFDGTYANFRKRVHPDDIGYIEQQIEQALTVGLPYSYHFRAVGDDGKERRLRGKATVIRDKHWKPTRVVGVTTVEDDK